MDRQKQHAKMRIHIAKELLRNTLPFLFGISILATVILLFTPNLQATRLLPGGVLIVGVWAIWALYKKGMVTLAVNIFILFLYSAVFSGMILNGGVKAPIFSALIALSGVVSIYFNRRIALVIWFIVALISAIIVFLSVNYYLREPGEVSPVLHLILNLIYQILLIQTVFSSMKMLYTALGESEDKQLAIFENQRYIETIIHSIGETLITVDSNGHITQRNVAANNLLSLDKEQHITLKDIALTHPEDKNFSLREAVADAPKFYAQMKLSVEDKEIIVSLSIYPMHHKSIDEKSAVIVIKDISEEVLLREQLAQSQKMEAVGQLSSGIAHDFNNMLGGILGAAELLADERNKEENIELLDIIKKSAKRAAGLTRQLLDFSRKGKYASTSINMHKVINDTAEILKRTIDKSIKIELDLHSEYYKIMGDDSQLQNGLMNIGINASHAMPDGGILRFETEQVFLDESFCKSVHQKLTVGEYLAISIHDTGTGMSPEVMKKIFEPFYTTKEQGKGTGLGLAAVHGIVESHQGAIRVESILGEGSHFYLYFPLQVEQFKEVTTIIETKSGNGEKILIVDDEELMRITAKLILSKLNYMVDTAENGEQAVEMYARNHYDLILLDMIMPGINGRKTFEKLQEIDPEVAVILASGFSKDTDIKMMFEKGLKGFIRKPYRQSDLSNTITTILG